MGKLAFLTAVGFLGYLLGDGEFGAKLINAFEYISVLYWIGFFIIILINVALIVGLGFAGQDKFKNFGNYSFVGSLGGVSLGILIAAVTLFFPVVQLWLLSNILETIDPNVLSFNDIQDKTYIYMWGILAILGSFIPSAKISK